MEWIFKRPNKIVVRKPYFNMLGRYASSYDNLTDYDNILQYKNDKFDIVKRDGSFLLDTPKSGSYFYLNYCDIPATFDLGCDFRIGDTVVNNSNKEYIIRDVLYDEHCSFDIIPQVVFILVNRDASISVGLDTMKKNYQHVTQDDFTDDEIAQLIEESRKNFSDTKSLEQEIISMEEKNMLTETTIETKGEKNMSESKTSMEAPKTNKIIELNKLTSFLSGYIVNDPSIGVSLNGVSIDGRVWHEQDGFYQVDDTTWTGIPVGFRVPTQIENVKINDIVFTSKGKPYIVKSKNSNGTLNAVDPVEETELTLHPSKSMVGYKIYDVLVTPFNFQNTINPIANICVASAFAFQKGGTDEIVDVLLPQALPLLTAKTDIGALLTRSQWKWLAPVGLILMELCKDKSIDFSNTDKIKTWCRENKKQAWILVLVILVLLYLCKDTIANKLLTDRIAQMPIIGRFATPIGKLLQKMPKVQNKIINKIEGKQE